MSTSAHVTVSSSDTKGGVIRFDPSYIKTVPGVLKIAEALLSLIGFICVYTIYSGYGSAGGWYSFVSMTGFWIELVVGALYIFHLVEKISFMPWLLCEFIFATAWTALFFIAACVAAAHGRLDPGWGAAAFFGFLVMFVFGYEAYLKYKGWKRGDPAQGEKTTANSETNTAPSYPTY